MSKTLEKTIKLWMKLRELYIATLFVTELDSPITRRQIQNRINYYGKVTNSDNEVQCGPHVFRRSLAKWLIQNNVDIGD